MANIIPNQPVSFGHDITDASACKCSGQEYLQLANWDDDIQFQIGNPCQLVTSSNAVQNPNFDDGFDYWSFEPAGTSINWSSGTNAAVAIQSNGTSGILYQSGIGLEIDILHKVKFTVTFGGTGCKLLVVVSDDSMATYTVIGTYTESGTYYIPYIPDKTYTSIGFVFIGNCEISNSLDDIEVWQYTSNQCLSFCVKDRDGNVVVDDNMFDSVEYYSNYVNIKTNWGRLFDGHPDGCYKICVCRDEYEWETYFGKNLFTYGTSGTMEQPITDLTDMNGNLLIQDTEYSFRGIWSAKSYNTLATIGNLLLPIGTLYLKPNTKYVAVAWVYIPVDPNPTPNTAKIYLTNQFAGSSLYGLGTLELEITPRVGQWTSLYMYFQTASDYTNTSGNIWVQYQDWDDGDTYYCYIDEIQLYEYNELITCSQLFSLRSSHDCTSLIRYTNEVNAFGLSFSATSLTPSIRVKSKLRNSKWTKGEKEHYENSDGDMKITYAKPRKHFELAISEQPEYMHDAINIALNCDNVTVDGIPVIMEDSDYSPNWRKSSDLAPVNIDLREKKQNLYSKK